MKRALPLRGLWAFDFDGTLSPLVADRRAAALHPACRSMLRDLARVSRRVVAVLSSRSLGDLVPRVPVPGVYLGGGSGLEWRTPGGHRIGPGEEAERALAGARRRAAPLLKELRSIPGVDVEDKRWSVAVHYRHAAPEFRAAVADRFRGTEGGNGLRVFRGPEVVEIQFLPQVDKSRGIRALARFLHFDPRRGALVFAGDDENDAAAMRWVLSRGGVAIGVGGRVRVAGARAVGGPGALARTVRDLGGVRK